MPSIVSMAMKVSLSVASRHFTQFVRRAEAGKEIAITRRGEIVALLLPPIVLEKSLDDAQVAIDTLKEIRKNVSPGGVHSRDMLRGRLRWSHEPAALTTG